jgi:DNA-binding transcriptional ArsR family regulator
LNVNRKETLCVVLVVLFLTASFTVLAGSTDNFGYGVIADSENPQRIALTTPIVLSASLRSATPPLSQPTRLEIYRYIQANPGVHFRGICKGLDVSVGVVQYHLDVLVHANLIRVYEDGQNRRYFAGSFDENEAKLIMLLRHEASAKILSILLNDGSALHKDISRTLGVSSQALSCQMNQLEKVGLVDAVREGINVMYMLNPTRETDLKSVFVIVGFPEI